MYSENPFDAEFGGIPELYLDTILYFIILFTGF